MSEEKIDFDIFCHPRVVMKKLHELIEAGKLDEKEALEIYLQWKQKRKVLGKNY